MSKQKHDIGHRKRLGAQEARRKTTGGVSTERLAQSLVLRGLATHRILDRPLRHRWADQ